MLRHSYTSRIFKNHTVLIKNVIYFRWDAIHTVHIEPYSAHLVHISVIYVFVRCDYFMFLRKRFFSFSFYQYTPDLFWLCGSMTSIRPCLDKSTYHVPLSITTKIQTVPVKTLLKISFHTAYSAVLHRSKSKLVYPLRCIRFLSTWTHDFVTHRFLQSFEGPCRFPLS